jgi:Fic family protein
MQDALDNLEKFLHHRGKPALIHCGLAHAQFETIHPFLDGNGRVGRLLIAFHLCWRGVLHQPLLYLSHYLRQRRTEYYDHLQAVRDQGEWEAWLGFFLRGIREVAEAATHTARAILDLRERHRQLLAQNAPSSHGMLLLDHLFEHPVTTVRLLQTRLRCAYGTANRLARRLVELKLLDEETGKQRYRFFRYAPYLALFESATPPGEAGGNRASPG